MRHLLCLGLTLSLLGCRNAAPSIAPEPAVTATGETQETADPLVLALRDQLTWGTTYDPSYQQLDYPGGDVPRDKGVCTDVVIRAYRAIGFDLQKLVHEDAKADRSRYPRIKSLDSNIDHRRCPNLISYLQAHAQQLTDEDELKPGDVIFWKLDNGLDHVGMLTDRRGPSGDLMAMHNISRPAEEDVLHRWEIVEIFRWRP